MINYFKNSFKINLTCAMNILIYGLKKIPLIKKIVPFSLYGNESVKSVIIIFIGILIVIKEFIFKGIYIALMVFFPAFIMVDNGSDYFIKIILFLTVIGALTNSEITRSSKEKFYAITLMNMDPKRYAKTMYIAYLMKTFLFFFFPLMGFGIFLKISSISLLLLLLIIIFIKIIGDYINLYFYEKEKKGIFKTILVVTPIYLVGLAIAYVPINSSFITSFMLLILFIILSVFAYICFKKILNYDGYRILYKSILTANNIIFNVSDAQKKYVSIKMQKNISVDTKDNYQHKKGYEYFNALFVSRHKKILLNSALKFAGFIAVVIVALIVGIIFNVIPPKEFNGILLMRFPVVVFALYFTNRGASITQAMFFNCDHSMLSYKFYRSPKSILTLFKIRLKTLITINFIPSSILAIGLPLLLYISGGSSINNYVGMFLMVIFLSVFFSIHYMVIYYLLQPYDINMHEKGLSFSIVNALTYFVCYFCFNLRCDAFVFSIGVIVFTILYVDIALILAYRLAPQRFRLK